MDPFGIQGFFLDWGKSVLLLSTNAFLFGGKCDEMSV